MNRHSNQIEQIYDDRLNKECFTEESQPNFGQEIGKKGARKPAFSCVIVRKKK